MKKTILLILALGLLTAGLLASLQSSFVVNNPLPSTASVGGEGSSFEASFAPKRIVIPAIGVDALVQKVGLTPEGDMGIPTNFTDVAWYAGGVAPGMPGSAVVAGHLDGKNVPKAVFYELDNLKVGDLVEVVDEQGTTFQFRVVNKKIFDYDDPAQEVFSGDTKKARLNLITCTGSWIKESRLYDKRVVVFTELVS